MFHPDMPYRSVGRSGLKVSIFGLGGWTTFGGSVTDLDLVKKIHHRAYEAGVNFYDNADIYAKGESERIVGLALKEFPRHELVVSSKTFWPMSDDINDKGLSRKHIMESVEKSLRRMGTDYLDIYFCHRFDSETPLEETIRAMDDLVHQGKILYWGTSEWTGEQLREAHRICEQGGFYKPQVEQPQYNLLAREKFEEDVAPTAARLGMGLVTWSPLASGALTGKYDHAVKDGRLSRIDWLRETLLTPENQSRILEFKKVADEIGVSRTELALAWTAFHPHVSSVILGATRIEQLEQNLAALKVRISAELDQKLKRIFP
jgi:voltage-dependent potassium channel beta subunit